MAVVVAYVILDEADTRLAYRAGQVVGKIDQEGGIWYAWCFTNEETKAFRKVREAKMWLEGQVKTTTEVR